MAIRLRVVMQVAIDEQITTRIAIVSKPMERLVDAFPRFTFIFSQVYFWRVQGVLLSYFIAHFFQPIYK